MEVRAQALNNIVSIRTKVCRSIGVFEGASILGMVMVVAVCIAKRSFLFSGTVLGASLIAYLLAFFLASYGLRRQGLGIGRFFYALAGVISGIWLYEIAYHYQFPIHWTKFIKELIYINTNISATNFPLLWSLMMVLVVFAGYRYMSVTKWFWIALLISAGSFAFWIWIGSPQWTRPENWPMRTPLINLIPLEYTHAPNDIAKQTISTVSLIINSFTKIPVCALLSTLFLKNDPKGRIFCV
ncbi:MAG: hypothetical protein A2144_10780 [Chloroflexi bacterium RBG_16_50_9]|nr:MAG: hypothetical protein A2144_10780 [Chloroflexi bacterium RBG_16_50_9]